MTAMPGLTCLVTGATSGIGQETARRRAAPGATVIIVARGLARRGGAGGDQLAGPGRLWALSEDLVGVAPTRRGSDG